MPDRGSRGRRGEPTCWRSIAPRPETGPSRIRRKRVALGLVGGPAQLCDGDLRPAEGARVRRRAADDPCAAVRQVLTHGGGARIRSDPQSGRPNPLVDCPRMTVRELLGDGPALEVGGLAYDNRSVTPGTLFFCVPGFTRDGHDFAPDAVSRGAAALVVARPLELGVPEVQVEDVRAAMAVAAARFHGDPTARLPVVGITGTNGKTTTAFLVRALLEASGRQTGLLGTVTSVVAGRGAPNGAHDAGGDRPPAHVPRDARRRRCRVRDGDLLARARAAPRRRDPRRGGGVHQPHTGPPRLPCVDGGVLPRQAAAVRVSADRCSSDQQRRRVGPQAGRGVPRQHDVRDRRARRLPRHRARGRLQRDRLHVRDARRRVPRARPAAGPLQRAQRAGGVGGGAGAGRRGRRAARGGARAGALRAGRRGPAVRRARGLRPHARLARERPARGARAGRRAA